MQTGKMELWFSEPHTPNVKLSIRVIDLLNFRILCQLSYHSAVPGADHQSLLHMGMHRHGHVKFVRSKENEYDLIIVDSTDPFGPGEGWYRLEAKPNSQCPEG